MYKGVAIMGSKSISSKLFISYAINSEYFKYFPDGKKHSEQYFENVLLLNSTPEQQECMKKIKECLFHSSFYYSLPKSSPALHYKWYKVYEAKCTWDNPRPEICAKIFNNEFTTIHDKLNLLYYSLATQYNNRPSTPLDKNISYTQINTVINTIWNKIKPNVLNYLESDDCSENYKAFTKLVHLSAIYNSEIKLDYMVKTPMFPEITNLQDKLDYMKKLGQTIQMLPELIKQDNELLKERVKLRNKIEKMQERCNDISRERVLLSHKILAEHDYR